MNKSTTIFRNFVMAASLFFSTHIYAQTDSSRIKEMTDHMQKQLTLDSVQYNKVYAVNEKFINRMASLKNAPGRKLSKLREMKSVSEDRDKQMKKILTSDQYIIYEQAKEANRQKMREGYKNNPR